MQSSYEYATIRVVPRVEREEFVTVGVILFCRVKRYLAARVALDTERLALRFPELDVAVVVEHLEAIPSICLGGSAAGPIGALSQPERFHWLVAPRSTIIQTSQCHSGLCDDPEQALEHLVRTLVPR